MQNQATTKRSPIVPIRTFVMIELLWFVAYLLAAGHGNYKYEFYTKTFFSNLIAYDSAKFLLLSGGQLLITIYAFMLWYYETYSVRPNLLTHQCGVFFRKNKSMALDKSMTVTVSSGPLAKLFHYGTIRIENGVTNKAIKISDISRPREFLKIIERSMNPENNHFYVEPNLVKLMALEEHERLEFKSSLRYDHKIGQTNRELERTAMKTIAAFLNTKGGHLVIGISDKKEPIGLEKDYGTLRRPDSDGFENHFTLVFNTMIGPEFRHFVKVWFSILAAADICIVQVAPSTRPVYLKFDDSEYFYVRTGNVTTPLKLSEVETYRRSRWPQRTMINV